MSTTAKSSAAYVQPEGVIEETTPLLEIDIGHGITLFVMSTWCNMHLMLRDFREGHELVQTAWWPQDSSTPRGYSTKTWTYFFTDSVIVISNGDFHATLQLPLAKNILSQRIIGTDHIMFGHLLRKKQQLLKAQKEAQEKTKEKPPITTETSPELFNQAQLNTDASDFTIICKDEVSIPVHTAILSTFWPFFQNMMSNDCKEKTERTLRLDFPSDWISAMVAHIYQQPVKLTFEEATGALVLAEMYLLPDLEEEASQQIKTLVSDETTIEELIVGWTRSREADNGTMRQFFAQKIARKSPVSHSELFKGWEEMKLLELFSDTAKVV